VQQTVKTTVRVKLHSLTNRKSDLLTREYEAFQTEVHGGDADLYSATDQQVSKVQRQKDPNPPVRNNLSSFATTYLTWPTTKTRFSRRGG